MQVYLVGLMYPNTCTTCQSLGGSADRSPTLLCVERRTEPFPGPEACGYGLHPLAREGSYLILDDPSWARCLRAYYICRNSSVRSLFMKEPICPVLLFHSSF